MKFTKLLPIAVMAMFAVPAFAADSTQSQLLQITVPQHFHMANESGTVSTTASFNDEYSTITLGDALNAKFRVYTNYHENTLKLTAKAATSGADAEALYGTAAAPILVFTNTTYKPADTSVTNITGGSPAAKDNPNAIAFALTRTTSMVADSGPSDTIGENLASNTLTYTMGNGQFEFNYDMDTTAQANTFSTMDEEGTYQCTLTLAQYTAP